MSESETLDLRRRIDHEMSESLREYRHRMVETSERLTRIDEALSYLKLEFSTSRESRLTIQEQQTVIAERLTALSARFMEHIEDESAERELLQAMTRQVSAHSVRLTGLERFQIALWSIAGTVSAGALTWAISHFTLNLTP